MGEIWAKAGPVPLTFCGCSGPAARMRKDGCAMKQFVAGSNEEGVRLSRFVQGVTTGLPASLMYKSFRARRIKVNGRRAAPDDRLHAGDQIELYLNDEFFAPAPAPKPSPAPAKLPKVTVVYEDAQIALLYKPAHLLCHSDRTGDASLIEAFTALLTARGEYDPAAERRFAPALCNRLDRGTEGLVVAAKTYPALRDMNEAIRQGWVQKEYLTITCGVPPGGRHTAYLRHDERTNRVSVRADAAPGYKESITEVSVLRTSGPFALCRIGLITGRTHQIRAHLAFLGAPVLGDVKYGSRKLNERTGCRTQALCAQRLTFGQLPEASCLHDLSGKVVELEAPAILAQFEALAQGGPQKGPKGGRKAAEGKPAAKDAEKGGGR